VRLRISPVAACRGGVFFIEYTLVAVDGGRRQLIFGNPKCDRLATAGSIPRDLAGNAQKGSNCKSFRLAAFEL